MFFPSTSTIASFAVLLALVFVGYDNNHHRHSVFRSKTDSFIRSTFEWTSSLPDRLSLAHLVPFRLLAHYPLETAFADCEIDKQDRGSTRIAMADDKTIGGRPSFTEFWKKEKQSGRQSRGLYEERQQGDSRPGKLMCRTVHLLPFLRRLNLTLPFHALPS